MLLDEKFNLNKGIKNDKNNSMSKYKDTFWF